VSVTGVDLSGGMVERARELNPGIEFRQGDMRCLDLPDGALTAAVAF
jgi:ubiquinone/menaquinone biosynthesis C-methylase UbiE